ncbi:MAG TPA: THUMP domain-containing protein [Cytophagaceae bacterium]|jgi:23S rRNA G2445 N2-methylase RlmL|nr:THUMP domain-containing protein [Cytophagaceae bacterium]
MNIDTLIREKRTIQINTAPGMNEWLEKELIELGYSSTKTGIFGVTLQGNLNDCISLNLRLRTAHRILLELKTVTAHNAQELYDQAYLIPWENLIEKNGYVSVDSFVKNDTMVDPRFANVRIKDAIADRFMQLTKQRPDSGSEFIGTVIYLFWINEKAVIYLDTTGPTLSKHGYRKITTEAPLLESLASALIMASDWDKKSNFVNPFCGSGTLAIEAAWMATGMTPGLNRDKFGFMHVKGYNPKYYNQNIEYLDKNIKKNLDFRILASDRDKSSVEAAKINAKAAGVDHLIDFTVQDFQTVQLPEQKGTILMNPPYGERMGDKEQLKTLYGDIGAFFKKSPGWGAAVLSADKEVYQAIRLKPKQRIPFLNGRIDCRLLTFELYEGSRRSPREE